MAYRLDGKDALSTVIKAEKNVNILEKAIYAKTGSDEKVYKEMVYEIITDISNGCKLVSVLEMIKTCKTGWQHRDFENTRFQQEERDNFIINPFEVEEGVLKCGKCGNSRTFSYTKQVRSCDEGTSVFAFCMTCKHKWIHAG